MGPGLGTSHRPKIWKWTTDTVAEEVPVHFLSYCRGALEGVTETQTWQPPAPSSRVYSMCAVVVWSQDGLKAEDTFRFAFECRCKRRLTHDKTLLLALPDSHSSYFKGWWKMLDTFIYMKNWYLAVIQIGPHLIRRAELKKKKKKSCFLPNQIYHNDSWNHLNKFSVGRPWKETGTKLQPTNL